MRALLLSLLFGCSSGEPVHTGSWYRVGDSGCCFTETRPTYTGTFPVTDIFPFVNWVDVDGMPPEDTDGVIGNDIHCSEDFVEVIIEDPMGLPEWSFGMAEIGPMGWTGEDCFNGYAGFNICHTMFEPILQLTEVCAPSEVVPGSTTLFDADKHGFLTYMASSFDSCFVWGADPAYYAALGCREVLY